MVLWSDTHRANFPNDYPVIRNETMTYINLGTFRDIKVYKNIIDIMLRNFSESMPICLRNIKARIYKRDDLVDYFV